MALEMLVPLDLLIPLQVRGVSAEHLERLSIARNDGDIFPPVLLTPHTPEYISGTQLLLDGAHRSVIEHLRGSNVIRSLILTTDEDLQLYKPDFLEPFKTLEEIRVAYLTNWRHKLVQQGFDGINDLPLQPGEKYNLADIN